jgi:hypothetical protein
LKDFFFESYSSLLQVCFHTRSGDIQTWYEEGRKNMGSKKLKIFPFFKERLRADGGNHTESGCFSPSYFGNE